MKILKLISLAVLIVLSACSGDKKNAADSNTYYTCSMHPQIMEPEPGTCAICKMDLIAVQKNTSKQVNELMLSDQQIQLGNIQTDTVKAGGVNAEITVTATLNTDENLQEAISAKVAGRVERLYIKNIGDFVPAGSKLMDIYSEELNSAKQEYLAALEKQQEFKNGLIDYGRLLQSAKQKLLLWGMTAQQVKTLAAQKKIDQFTTFYSKKGGYITELMVTEGDYVMEGSLILKLADLSNLWAEAQLYASQLAQVNLQQTVKVSIPDFPEKEMMGRVDFQNPEINDNSRVNLIRINVANKDLQLKPGMLAYVKFKGKTSANISVPVKAVIRNGKTNVVWLKTGKNTYTQKEVSVGIENNNQIEIKQGLKTGDLLVTSGAYLLSSELTFKQGS
jgi:Cu(I)/Ag(I) efflux system membrane fusion protein